MWPKRRLNKESIHENMIKTLETARESGGLHLKVASKSIDKIKNR